MDRTRILKSVRYWDKAGTEDGGAFTAGALLHALRDKRYVIEHVVRGQWGALDREERIKFWAERDRANARPGTYEVVVEQEPGSGGKESAENTIRNLPGFKVAADKVTGSKEVRADPFAAQVQAATFSSSPACTRMTSLMRWCRGQMASIVTRLTRALGRSTG